MVYRTFVTREARAFMAGQFNDLRLTVPTILLLGRHDPVIQAHRLGPWREHADDMVVEVRDDAGHFLPGETRTPLWPTPGPCSGPERAITHRRPPLRIRFRRMASGNRGAQVVALIAVLAAGWAPVATAAPPQPWVQVVAAYPLATGVFLTQGIASDGANLFFSYKFGVLRADLDGTLDTPPKPTGIPPAIAALGGDHMGDIDVHGGFIYAPIEDGAAGYHHPFIARYDAATMAYTGTSWELDHTLLTDRGAMGWRSTARATGSTRRGGTTRSQSTSTTSTIPTSVTTVPLQLPRGRT